MKNQIILSYGEALWDLLPTGEVLGGAPFNFAYRAHSLGSKSLMISRLGRDDYGRRAMDKITELGMDNSMVQWDDERPTGTVQIELDEHNQPDYYIVPHAAYDRIELSDEMLALAAQAKCICFGTLAQREEGSRATLLRLLDEMQSKIKLLDINLRKDCYSTDIITQSLSEASMLKLNEDEAPYLSSLFSLPDNIPDFCSAMIERWSLSHCLVTLGDKGVFAGSADGGGVYAPGFKVELADPCGAGDAFTAGFIDRLFRGKALGECCRFGNALGALVAAQQGATVPVSIDEIQQFLDSNPAEIVDESFKDYRIG